MFIHHDFDYSQYNYFYLRNITNVRSLNWKIYFCFSLVSKTYKKYAEFCSDHKLWKLNMAHMYFVTGVHHADRYAQCIPFYEQIVKQHNNILDVSAVVLGNLCVAYVMTSQNEEAEDVMRSVEKEEEKVISSSNRTVHHLCIINLIIGTLYCSKGNYEFGISRVMKALEPMERKLDVDTWYYAKQCILALLEMLAKNMILIKDTTVDEIVFFLDEVAVVGANRDAVTGAEPGKSEGAPNTIGKEARLLKKMFIRLRPN